jgi:hypothetical protein
MAARVFSKFKPAQTATWPVRHGGVFTRHGVSRKLGRP